MTREEAVRIVDQFVEKETWEETAQFKEALRHLLKENKRVSWQLDQAIKRAVGYCKEIKKLREY